MNEQVVVEVVGLTGWIAAATAAAASVVGVLVSCSNLVS